MRIREIYQIQDIDNTVTFCGHLRNEKKFELHQEVFIQWEGKLFRTKIFAIELPPVMNSSYKYKVRLPEGVVNWKGDDFQELICDHIFSSIEEARKSAEKSLENTYEIAKENLESYFKQYEK
jgi:hypothetical protein